MNGRKIFFGVAIALIFLLAVTPQALAQDANRLSQFKISVWPEYDTPSVLVLLDGTLADKSNLPREVSVLIPTGAQLTVTTYQNADGTLAAEQPNKVADLGDGYSRVTFTTNQPTFRVEYYHDLLRGSPDKTLDFAYKLAVPADQVTLDVQQPLKATNFAVNPSPPNTRTDTDGFKYFTSNFSNVAAGQVITTQVKYTKSDANPSVTAQTPAQPAPASAASTAPANNSSSNLLILGGVVTLGLAAVLGFFYWQQQTRQTQAVASKMSPRQFQRERRRARGTDSKTAFCTQCGNALKVDDVFCPKCGTKRRAG
jgi:hypothetical protein